MCVCVWVWVCVCGGGGGCWEGLHKGYSVPYLMLLFYAGEEPYMCTLSGYTSARAE